MSWDVELRSSAAEAPLGPAEEVRAAISGVHPDVDWTDPGWGVLERDEWTIELNMDTEPLIRSIMLHVRGSGHPVAAIAAICRQTGWVATDLATGKTLDPDRPSERGWRDFQQFRDSISREIGTGDGTSLPKVHLTIDGTTLHRGRGGRGARSHDLSKAAAVRFERAINPVSIVAGLLSLAIGIALKWAIPFAWLGWVCAVVFCATAIVFLATARADWLVVVEESGEKFSYPLAGTPYEVDAFRATIQERIGRTPE